MLTNEPPQPPRHDRVATSMTEDETAEPITGQKRAWEPGAPPPDGAPPAEEPRAAAIEAAPASYGRLAHRPHSAQSSVAGTATPRTMHATRHTPTAARATRDPFRFPTVDARRKKRRSIE